MEKFHFEHLRIITAKVLDAMFPEPPIGGAPHD